MASQRFGWLTASLNLGVEGTTAGAAPLNGRYGVSLQAQGHTTLTFALDLLGRWEPAGNGRVDHTVDLALGAQWNPWGTVTLEANLQRALPTGARLRSGITWTISVHALF